MRPEKKVAIVTGGSRGIGAAICQRLAEQGIIVHLVYNTDGISAQKVVDRIQARGGDAHAHRADVSREHQVRTLVDQVADQEGGIHILVNNAGVIDDRLLALTRIEQWERVIQVNLTGPFLMCRAVVPIMLEQLWGRIINISSNSARIPGAGQAAYAASKGGLEAMTRALAMEVGRKGIQVNTVAPGKIRTDMTGPLSDKLGGDKVGSRWGNPEDIAAMVDFLAGDDAGYIQGQLFTVDGGRLVMRPQGTAGTSSMR